MKLSTVFAKCTSAQTRSFKNLKLSAALVAAGAAMTLAAPLAQAQQWGVGVEIGGPRYVAPAPVYGYAAPAYSYGYAPGYGQERRAEEWREQQWRAHEWGEREAREHAYREHEEWEHHRDFDGYRDRY